MSKHQHVAYMNGRTQHKALLAYTMRFSSPPIQIEYDKELLVEQFGPKWPPSYKYSAGARPKFILSGAQNCSFQAAHKRYLTPVPVHITIIQYCSTVKLKSIHTHTHTHTHTQCEVQSPPQIQAMPIAIQALLLRSPLFWIKGQESDSWLLKMGPIGCPETSKRNYHHSPRNNPEERSSHLFQGGSLKSRKH